MKTFAKRETGENFDDGAFSSHNCPVIVASGERGLLWDNVGCEQLDIFLSLGTGQGANAVKRANSRSEKLKDPGSFVKMWEIAKRLLENTLECDGVWNSFVSASTGSCCGDPEFKSRYVRLNVGLRDMPRLDDVGEIGELESQVTKNGVPRAREIAHRLVASCFYLEPEVPADGSTRRITGTICVPKCKFQQHC